MSGLKQSDIDELFVAARERASDEGVFSPDQIGALNHVLMNIETAIKLSRMLDRTKNITA